MTVDEQLAEDKRIYGNSFHYLKDDKKVRISPLEVVLNAAGQYVWVNDPQKTVYKYAFRAPPFGGLGASEVELLAILSEECSEVSIECAKVVQAVQKVLRFTKQGCAGYNNLEALETEVGHLMSAIQLLYNSGFISESNVLKHRQAKLDWIASHNILQQEINRG